MELLSINCDPSLEKARIVSYSVCSCDRGRPLVVMEDIPMVITMVLLSVLPIINYSSTPRPHYLKQRNIIETTPPLQPS